MPPPRLPPAACRSRRRRRGRAGAPGARSAREPVALEVEGQGRAPGHVRAASRSGTRRSRLSAAGSTRAGYQLPMPLRPERRKLPRGVCALGFVSLFMDTSSELIHACCRCSSSSTLGASALTFGLLEGVAEAAALFTKMFSGAVERLFRPPEAARVVRLRARGEQALLRAREHGRGRLRAPRRPRGQGHPRRPARRADRRHHAPRATRCCVRPAAVLDTSAPCSGRCSRSRDGLSADDFAACFGARWFRPRSLVAVPCSPASRSRERAPARYAGRHRRLDRPACAGVTGASSVRRGAHAGALQRGFPGAARRDVGARARLCAARRWWR